MDWLRETRSARSRLRASVLALVCVIAAGCTPPKARDTQLSLALSPDASCFGADAVDLVDHLAVRLLTPTGATIDTWEFPFTIGGAAVSLGDVPHDGSGKFVVSGTGPVCGVVATTIFDGESAVLPFDPDDDQSVAVPVSCRTISPCNEPSPTPTPFASAQPADLVLGQPDFLTCNGGGLGIGRRFEEPDGLELAYDVLWVSDRGFNRVAAFTGAAALTSGAQITFTVGQNGLLTTGNGDTSVALDHPRSAIALGDRLVVVDGANHRGQVTPPIPDASGADASFAIGQDSANNDNAVNAADPVGANTLESPWGAAESGGNLYVADTGSHRLLRFPVAALGANRPAADLVLGQADFTSSAANRGGSAAPETLSSPAHVATDGLRLWVADTGNDRVLAYDLATLAIGAPATLVIINGGGGTTLLAPRGVAASAERLVIADSGNHRVLVWEPPPLTAADPPTAVLGQTDFTGVTANAGGNAGGCPTMETCVDPAREPTGSTLSRPGAVMLRGDDLWVSDTCNARVLRYRAPTR